MCGIVGRWAADGSGTQLGPGVLASLRHRGPDDVGSVSLAAGQGRLSLGHTRLAIIDLSDQGHQPMVSRDGRYTLVFNGEVYNYRELRTELSSVGVRFHGESDTEVLLEAWARWGPACLSRLVGMFAFAIFDSHASKLTCVRDPFGIKPLFYSQHQQSFAFASELQTLLEVAGTRPRLDLTTAYEYLVWGAYDVGERTFVEGVRQLPPGHLLDVGLLDGTTETRRWWHPSVEETFDGSFDEAADAVRHTFLDSVRLHLRSDVPLGAALSGGIDSAAIVCATRHLEPDADIRTFTYVSDDAASSERLWARAVIEHTKAHSSEVTLTAEDLSRDLPDLLRSQGEPFGSTSLYASYGVMRAAREAGITVMLEGQGADEVFGGYHGYPGHRFRTMIDNGSYLDATRFLSAWSRWPGRSWRSGLRTVASQLTPRPVPNVVSGFLRRNTCPAWIRRAAVPPDAVSRHFDNVGHVSVRGRRTASALRGAMTGLGLPALLRHSDRNGMNFSIEGRVPFLTPQLASLALSLPESYLVSPQGETKSVLRAALRGIVPDVVLDRPDKVAFSTPEGRWLPTVLAARLPHLVIEDELAELIDPTAAQGALHRAADRQVPVEPSLWRLFNIVDWSHRLLSP